MSTLDLLADSLAPYPWGLFGIAIAAALPPWCLIGWLIRLAEREGDHTNPTLPRE